MTSKVASVADSRLAVRKRSLSANRKIAGFLFVLPALVFIVLFFLIPLGLTLWMSLHNWPLFGEASFNGIDNYLTLFRDRQFWQSLRFTVIYTLLVTPPIFVVGFAMALLVNQAFRAVGLFRTIFFLPNVIGFSAACLLWYWMLNDQVGIINHSLRSLGILRGSFNWLAEYDSALLAIIIMVVWKTAGGTMLLLLVGMQAIPDELYEAAKVDGADALRRLRHITLPLLRRSFALALVLSVTGSMLAFDQFSILTTGGPQNKTVTTVYWIVNSAFRSLKLGYSASASVLLLVILIGLNALQLRFLRDTTQY